MLVNTLGINLIGNVVGIFVAITFALFINEIANPKFKSAVQTVTYMPHFISWVVFGGIAITMLSADGGMLNQILLKLGLIENPIVFMAEPKYFWAIAIRSCTRRQTLTVQQDCRKCGMLRCPVSREW